MRNAAQPMIEFVGATDRDGIAAKMTPDQVAEAQRMAREWLQSHPSKQ
jgi:hypothetical protein